MTFNKGDLVSHLYDKNSIGIFVGHLLEPAESHARIRWIILEGRARDFNRIKVHPIGNITHMERK